MTKEITITTLMQTIPWSWIILYLNIFIIIIINIIKIKVRDRGLSSHLLSEYFNHGQSNPHFAKFFFSAYHYYCLFDFSLKKINGLFHFVSWGPSLRSIIMGGIIIIHCA